jgi:hypothetical protein
LDHTLIDVGGGLVFSDLKVGIAQDAIGVTISGIEGHGFLRLCGGFVKAMAHVHGIGEMPRCPAVLRSDLQASLQGLLG